MRIIGTRHLLGVAKARAAAMVQLDRASNSLTLQLSHLYGTLLSSQDTGSSDEHTQQAAVRLLVPQLLLGV